MVQNQVKLPTDLGPKLYEGKAKVIFQGDQADELILVFKDDATAFNREKTGTISQKGAINNQISTKIFEYLNQKQIPNHFVKQLSPNQMVVKKLDMLGIEVIVRNRIAGSLARRLDCEEGGQLKFPIIEFCLKNDKTGDPFINEDIIVNLNLATEQELIVIKDYALKINQALIAFFGSLAIDIIDFKLEFGRFKNQILLADEITPDGCRLWDQKTGQKLDKDRFRFDLGKVDEAYREVLERLESRL